MGTIGLWTGLAVGNIIQVCDVVMYCHLLSFTVIYCDLLCYYNRITVIWLQYCTLLQGISFFIIMLRTNWQKESQKVSNHIPM